jgi:hypothetical protein
MAVETESSRQPTQYGDGVLDTFSFNFRALTSTDIAVYKNGVAVSSGITITVNANGVGGDVVFDTPPANDDAIIIIRVMDYTQPTSYPRENNFPEERIEADFDRSTMLIQQLYEELVRCIKIPITSEDPQSYDFPAPDPGKAVVWNAAGDALENSTFGLETISAELQAAADAAAADADAASAAAADADASADSATADAAAAEADRIAAAASAASAALAVSSAIAALTKRVFLETQNGAAGTYVTFSTTLSATYRYYEVFIDKAVPSIDNAEAVMEVYVGGSWKTANYHNAIIMGGSSATASGGGTSDASIRFQNNAAFSSAGGIGNVSPESLSGFVKIINPSDTNGYIVVRHESGYSNPGNTPISSSGYGSYRGAGAVTGIRFRMSSGNIVTGAFHLYGVQ